MGQRTLGQLHDGWGLIGPIYGFGCRILHRGGDESHDNDGYVQTLLIGDLVSQR